VTLGPFAFTVNSICNYGYLGLTTTQTSTLDATAFSAYSPVGSTFVVQTEDLTHLGNYHYEVKAAMNIDAATLPLFTLYGRPTEESFSFRLAVEMC